MQTAYVLKGHLRPEGTITLEEPAPLPSGPVLVTIQALREGQTVESGYTDSELLQFIRRIETITMMPGPPVPNDGISARDYKETLYGSEDNNRDVR